jgi:hypothetical protein
MFDWLENKRNLLFYTLFVLGLFFSVMIWLTPPSVGNKRFRTLSPDPKTSSSVNQTEAVPGK